MACLTTPQRVISSAVAPPGGRAGDLTARVLAPQTLLSATPREPLLSRQPSPQPPALAAPAASFTFGGSHKTSSSAVPPAVGGGWWDECLGMHGHPVAASLRASVQAPPSEVCSVMSGTAPSAYSGSRRRGGSSSAMAAVGLAAATAGRVAASAAQLAQTQGQPSPRCTTPRMASTEVPMSSAYPQSPLTVPGSQMSVEAPKRLASGTATPQLHAVGLGGWGHLTPPRSRSPSVAAHFATAEAAMSLLTVASSALGQCKPPNAPTGSSQVLSPMLPASVSIGQTGPARTGVVNGSLVVPAGGSASAPSLPLAASLSPSPRIVQAPLVSADPIENLAFAAPASSSSVIAPTPLVRVPSAGYTGAVVTPPPSKPVVPITPLTSFPSPETLFANEDSEWSPRNSVWKRYFSPIVGNPPKEEALASSRIQSAGVSPRLGITTRPDDLTSANAEDVNETKEGNAQMPSTSSPPILGVSVMPSEEPAKINGDSKSFPGLLPAGHLTSGLLNAESPPSKEQSSGGLYMQPPPLDFGSSSKLRESMEALRNAKAASESARKSWSGRRSTSRENSAGGFQGLQGSLVEDSGPEQEPSPSMQCLRDVVVPTHAVLAHERSLPSSRNDFDPLNQAPGSKAQSQLETHFPRRGDSSVVDALGNAPGPSAVSERRRMTPPRTPPTDLSGTSGHGGAGMAASGSSLRGLVGRFGAPLPGESPQTSSAASLSVARGSTSPAPSRQPAVAQSAESALAKAGSAPPSRQRSRMSDQEGAMGGPPSRQRSRPSELEESPQSHERGAPRLATANRAGRSRSSATSSQVAAATNEEDRVSSLLAFKEQAAAVACVMPENTEGTEGAVEAMKQAAALVQPRSFTELRTMRQPSKSVEQVIEAVAALFGLPEERWASLRRRFDNGLHGRIASFDLASASRIPSNRVERFLQLLREHPAFTDPTFPGKFPMVGPLQRWCLAVGDLLTRLHDNARDEEEQQSGDMLASNSISVPLPPYAVADIQQASSLIDAYSSVSDLGNEEVSQNPIYNSSVAIVVANDEVVPTPQGGITSEVSSRGPPVVVDQPPVAAFADVRIADMGEPPVLLPPISLPPDDEPIGRIAGLEVEPNIWRLNEAELASVRDLTISRKGVGRVTFHGETDCRGLLHEMHRLLVIDQGEVVVYPDASQKPPVGQGLNKPASVVLFGCMPKSKQRLSDPRAKDRYRHRVAQMTEEKGAIFEDYNCEDGTWKFRVAHF